MSFDEDKLRTMWQENTPQSDEDSIEEGVINIGKYNSG
jgi:hypothetical protein